MDIISYLIGRSGKTPKKSISFQDKVTFFKKFANITNNTFLVDYISDNNIYIKYSNIIEKVNLVNYIANTNISIEEEI